MENLLDLAKNVKRGVRLLDRNFPTWRRVLRAHADKFDLEYGDCCVLGTLEHHLGRARILRKRAGATETGYEGLKTALRLNTGHSHGFNWSPSSPEHKTTLTALWRAEFEA